MKVLLVIDMLYDFVNENGALYCGPEAKKIVPFIKSKIDEYHKNGNEVIFICDSHTKDDPEFKMFPPHCIKGTKGAEIIDELPKVRDDVIIKKRRYSGFYGTNLDRILEDISPESVEVVGVCTSICVMDTVGGLSNREIPVTVYKKGVVDFDKEMHEFSLKRMEKIYNAEVV
ncbi:MAG: isochorismatase family cysteine hydrolase [Candidatus Cloacimonadota bacterium]|nr:isochorismatase family cysteine hydrolase [Candidatus Cloacimonadota bacterium]